MSRPIKPARLWLELARRRPNGAIRPAAWVILDRGRKYSTGRAEADRVGAEAALERYLAQKRLGEITEQPDHGTDAAEVYVADALTLYASEQIEPRLTPQRTREFRAKVANLGNHLGTLTLAQLNGSACVRDTPAPAGPMLRHAESSKTCAPLLPSTAGANASPIQPKSCCRSVTTPGSGGCRARKRRGYYGRHGECDRPGKDKSATAPPASTSPGSSWLRSIRGAGPVRSAPPASSG